MIIANATFESGIYYPHATRDLQIHIFILNPTLKAAHQPDQSSWLCPVDCQESCVPVDLWSGTSGNHDAEDAEILVLIYIFFGDGKAFLKMLL
jgi:hypothetical protein